MNIRHSSSLPITRLSVPKPQHLRPALSRLGSWVRPRGAKMDNNNSSTAGAETTQLPPPPPLAVQVHDPARITSSSSSTSSSWDSTGAQQLDFVGDAGVDEGLPSDKDNPLPAFLKQTKGDIHAKFVDLEWQQRERLHSVAEDADEATSQWARLTGDEVAKRNRYFNVDPYAKNRVRLRVPDGHNDYINASPIKLDLSKGGEKVFIATQGPKEGSLDHFWRLIWDETADPAVVIMLTQTHESGREKCFQYFPLDASETLVINEADEFGDGFTATLTLKSITADAETRSLVRELQLQTPDGRTKTIWHFLFTGWPDFLIPEGDDRLALLNLLTLSQAKTAAAHPQSPRVVHCSAGVGRSGTFIALDWLLDELAAGRFDAVKDDEDPVVELVDRLRQQRMMMVQGDSQFAFLYEVLREKWVERWRRRQADA